MRHCAFQACDGDEVEVEVEVVEVVDLVKFKKGEKAGAGEEEKNRWSVKKIWKHSSDLTTRNRTKDTLMSANPLQSDALPTELW